MITLQLVPGFTGLPSGPIGGLLPLLPPELGGLFGVGGGSGGR